MQKFFIHSIILKKDKCPLKVATNLGTSASIWSELVAEMLDLVRYDRRLSILEVSYFMVV